MTTTFASVADEIIRALQRVPTDPSGQVERCLERWHWFWSLDPASLSEEAALGLFAELWFLDRWLGAAPDQLVHWTGPTGSRHDFQREEWSVEVKASAGRAAGGPVHTIGSLEQLDEPVTGNLYLFSLQVVEDALATNSLPRLVERIETRLAIEGGGVGTFRELLAKSGYNPAHRDRYERPLRIAAEELYRVAEGFPRLTSATFPSGLPPGVSAITYALSLSACAPWRVATTPRDAGASFLYSRGVK